MIHKTTPDRVHFESELFEVLKAGVQSGAEYLESVCSVVARKFPSVIWNEDTVWALLEREEIVRYFIQKIKERKAKALSLECNYTSATGNLSEEEQANRRVVSVMCKEDTAPLENLLQSLRWHAEEIQRIKTYLRAGVFHIQERGGVEIAPDSAQLLEMFCTLSIEGENEDNFYRSAQDLVKSAEEMRAVYDKLARQIPSEKDRADVEGCKFQFPRFRLCAGLTILGEDMPYRALLNFIVRYRENDKPRYYNRVGFRKLGLKRVYELTGYLPMPTPFLRVKFPELYEGAPYRNAYESSFYGVDNQKEFEEIQRSGIKIDDNGRPVVRGSEKEQVPALAVSVLYEI